MSPTKRGLLRLGLSQLLPGDGVLDHFPFFFFFRSQKCNSFFFLSEPICKCRKLIQKFKTYHDPKKKVCGPDSRFICHSCPDTAHTLFLCSVDPEPLKGKAKM